MTTRESFMAKETIFGRILKGEIPCDELYSDEHCIAFRDIQPQAPVHILIIPRKEIAFSKCSRGTRLGINASDAGVTAANAVP